MITRRTAISTGLAALAAPCMRAAADVVPMEYHAPREGCLRLACGRRISYIEYGDPRGPLAFYFHGTPGSRYEAGLIADEVAPSGVRLVAVDRPGMGRSSYYGCRRILDWPADVEGIAATLGAADQPFGILAMSGGAAYAAACAREIPHRLTHVAIVSGHAPMGAPGVCPGNQDELIELVGRRPRLSTAVFGFLGKRLRKRPDKVVQRVTSGWTADDRRLVMCTPKLRRQLTLNLQEASRCGPSGVIKDIRLLGRCWGFEVCEAAGAEVSIWQGGCDRIATPTMGRYFHQQIAGSELVLDPTAGHVTVLKRHSPAILARFL